MRLPIYGSAVVGRRALAGAGEVSIVVTAAGITANTVYLAVQ
jgi:hypothetical protein